MAIVKLMIGYALLLVSLGGLALALAPDPSRASTALIVSGACATLMIACAGMAAMLGKVKAIGMIGIHLGLALPLLFAGAFTQRAIATHGAISDYHEQRERFDGLVEADIEQDTEADFKNWLVREAYRGAFEAGKIDETVSLEAFQTEAEHRRARRVNDHDKTYLAGVLWALTAVSVLSFGLMLSKRPKPTARVETSEATDES